jgi:hypothetical protein
MSAPVSPLKFKRHQDCPDAAKRHSDPPRNMNDNGYSPTHTQVRCPTCGFYAVWEKRPKGGQQ